MKLRGRILALTLLASGAAVAEPNGGQVPADKSAYNLFNPAPAASLRPMTIDGPGATESPYTVDAGHFQVEMSLFAAGSYSAPAPAGTYRLDWWSVGPVNLKVGLFNSLDLQLVLEPYRHLFEREGDYRDTRSGFGDTTVRVKYNLWGNDGGRTALAVVPFATFPSSAPGVGNTHLEGGLLAPLEAGLPWDITLGVTCGVASAENALSHGRHAEFRNSIALGRKLFRDLEGYVEFFSAVSTERGVGWAGTFDSGLICWLSDNLQVNAGFTLGLTSWADDWTLFFGLAWRR